MRSSSFVVALTMLAAATWWPVTPAVSQDDLAFPEPAAEPVAQAIHHSSSNSGTISGVDGRVGFIGLPAYGRDTSIVPLELFPYVQSDDQILYGDLRGFLTTDGQLGGNLGVGYRFIEPNDVMLFGISGWYDADNSTEELYQQFAVGWEARMERIGLYGNVYMPVGTSDQVLDRKISNPRFDGTSILIDVTNKVGEAMPGMDLYLSGYLPGDFAEDHQVQATAGWYHFSGDRVDDINGFKLQLDGNFVPSLGGQVAVMHDNTFGTNVTLGLFWRFGTQQLPESDLEGQLRRFNNRNYNVIVSRRSQTLTGIEAISAATGSAYTVQHVSDSSLTQQGTVNSPFGTVAQAQAAGADIIFVHSGTSLSEDITLEEGQRLLGEGVSHTIVDKNYGKFTLPTATSGTQLADISGSSGTAVTMANNSEISGFLINGAGEHGILADRAENYRISNVTIRNSTGDGVQVIGGDAGQISNVIVDGGTGNGISLIDIDEAIGLKNIGIRDVSGDGIHVDSGHGEITFTDDLVIDSVGGAGVSVSNQEVKTETDTNGTATTSDDEEVETPGTVFIESLAVVGATGGTGISSVNNDGQVLIGAADISTQSGSALSIHDSEAFRLSNGYLKSVNAPVADIEGSNIDISVTSIKAESGETGLRIIDTEGQFLVYGAGKEGTGGYIKDTQTAVYVENGPRVGFQWMDFTNNDTVAYARNSDILAFGTSKFSYTHDTIIDAQNVSSLQVLDSTFENNTLSSGVGVVLTSNTDTNLIAELSGNTVKNFSGTFFEAKTLSGGEGSKLTLSFSGNELGLSGNGSMAAALDWTGTSIVQFASNKVTGSGTGQTAFELASGDSADVSQWGILQNTIVLSGDNSFGIDLDAQGPVAALIDTNQIGFNGLNGTGVSIALARESAVTLNGNQVVDHGGGATGILFTSIENKSQLALSGNTIDLSFGNTLVDRGIVLSTITANDGDDDPYVIFSSTTSNTIKGASTELQVPSEGVRGRLIINNSVIQ